MVFQGTITIGVEVWDKDKYTTDDFVEGTHITVPSVKPGPPYRPLRRKLMIRGSRISVGIQLELYCDKNYYGAGCNVKCIRGMTRAGTTHVITREERFAGAVGMEAVVHGIAFREMTRSMDTSPVIMKEISDVCETGKGHPVTTCVNNWYGPRCSTYCVPQDSDELGHYK